MGQYYTITNLDKKEYLNPHDFNNGAKLCEFGSSSDSAMFGLAILLSDGNGRGGGDVNRSNDELIGSWAGDRIVIAGDYADGLKFLNDEQVSDCETLQAIADKHYSKGYNVPRNVNLRAYASEKFVNISKRVLDIIRTEL